MDLEIAHEKYRKLADAATTASKLSDEWGQLFELAAKGRPLALRSEVIEEQAFQLRQLASLLKSTAKEFLETHTVVRTSSAEGGSANG